jgi:hypothetical protein
MRYIDKFAYLNAEDQYHTPPEMAPDEECGPDPDLIADEERWER